MRSSAIVWRQGNSSMNIQRDFEECLRLLEGHAVEYMIGGDYVSRPIDPDHPVDPVKKDSEHADTRDYARSHSDGGDGPDRRARIIPQYVPDTSVYMSIVYPNSNSRLISSPDCSLLLRSGQV